MAASMATRAMRSPGLTVEPICGIIVLEAMTVTTTERAAAIRAAYRAKGWTGRDISVRSESFSMGSAIRVSIKNPKVPFAWAKEIAEGHERIDRCSVSGEILSGCNRYVTVNYAHEAETAIKALYAAAMAEAEIALSKADTNSLVPIGETGFLLGNGRHGAGHGFSLWGDSHIVEAYNASGLATALHSRLVTA